MQSDYLDSVKKQFAYYKLLADKTFGQVPDDKLLWQYNEESNSMATIIHHLSGNMLSRWTDFLTSDGEKEWRNRDTEFENPLTTRDELLVQWEKGWKCLFDTLEELQKGIWTKRSTSAIRNIR